MKDAALEKCLAAQAALVLEHASADAASAAPPGATTLRYRARELKACGGGSALAAPPRGVTRGDRSSDEDDVSEAEAEEGEWHTIRSILAKRQMTTNLPRPDGGQL